MVAASGEVYLIAPGSAPQEASMPEPRTPDVSMRDLLAACAAADAVSRPPRHPDEARTDGASPADATNPRPDDDPAPHPRAA